MTYVDRFIEAAKTAGAKVAASVPDGLLADMIKALDAEPAIAHAACAREEECFGVAGGAALAGAPSLVLVQNAGFLNSLGAFATFCQRYRTPFVVVCANRGGFFDPNGYDMEKRAMFDAVAPALGQIQPCADLEALPDLIAPAFKIANAARLPAIIALEKGPQMGAAQ
jgi:pyruvate/2-oxoacid:ferredoxin oxidoreductase alpha subunit